MDFAAAAAIVTDDASGLGAGSVKRLVQAGANVMICDRNVELGADFAREIRAYFIALDVTDGAIRMAPR